MMAADDLAISLYLLGRGNFIGLKHPAESDPHVYLARLLLLDQLQADSPWATEWMRGLGMNAEKAFVE